MAENYDDSGKDKDAEFVEQISARLRASEHVHPSFEKRLMAKVRAEGGIHLPASGSAERSWWRAERVFSVTPLTGLAVAAGISLIIGVSGVAIGSRISARSSPVQTALRQRATRYRSDRALVFCRPHAAKVELVGDFNEWAKGSTDLAPSGAPGVWAVSVPPSRRDGHEYAFIINGLRAGC